MDPKLESTDLNQDSDNNPESDENQQIITIEEFCDYVDKEEKVK